MHSPGSPSGHAALPRAEHLCSLFPSTGFFRSALPQPRHVRSRLRVAQRRCARLLLIKRWGHRLALNGSTCCARFRCDLSCSIKQDSAGGGQALSRCGGDARGVPNDDDRFNRPGRNSALPGGRGDRVVDDRRTRVSAGRLVQVRHRGQRCGLSAVDTDFIGDLPGVRSRVLECIDCATAGERSADEQSRSEHGGRPDQCGVRVVHVFDSANSRPFRDRSRVPPQ